MHQGLIAQWHRGVAAKGIIGALLLIVPVMVAATIGVGGGVGGGLSSLATGPSKAAIGIDTATGEGKSRALDEISTTLPEVTAETVRRAQKPVPAAGGDGSGGITTGTSPGVTAPPGATAPAAPNKPDAGGTGGTDQPLVAPDQTQPPPGNGNNDLAGPVNDPIAQLFQNLAQSTLGLGG